MEWARLLANITGTVDQELLLRNEYLAAENRILKAQIRGRLCLPNADRATLGEIGHRLGRKALGAVANAALPDTILGWYRRLVARKFDGCKSRRSPGRPRLPWWSFGRRATSPAPEVPSAVAKEKPSPPQEPQEAPRVPDRSTKPKWLN
jgi:hypothetical protein